MILDTLKMYSVMMINVSVGSALTGQHHLQRILWITGKVSSLLLSLHPFNKFMSKMLRKVLPSVLIKQTLNSNDFIQIKTLNFKAYYIAINKFKPEMIYNLKHEK